MGWQDIMEVIKSAGSAAGPIFALLWWLERSERLEDRKMNEERSQRRDAALSEVKLAIATLSAIFNARPGQP